MIITLADFQKDDIYINIGFVSFFYILGAFATFAFFTPMPEFLKPFCCNRHINRYKKGIVIKLTALDPSQPDLLIDFPEQTNDSEMNSTEQSTL